jgi:anti-sigma factor RsiW
MKGDRMSHPPFETWILTDEPLDDEQRQMLEAHLQECESCRIMAESLMQMEKTFAQHPSPLPKPGFTTRWQTRLAITRQVRQQRRMWLLTSGLLGLTGLVVLVMFFLNINNVNWVYEISRAFAGFSVFASKVNHFFITINSLIRAFPIVLPVFIIFSVGILSLCAALIVTWFSSLIRLYNSPKEGVTAR